MDGIRYRFTLWRYSWPWRAPCSSERRGVIKERREGSLDDRGVRVVVSPKEERREGVWYRDEGEDQERTGGREKEKRIVHEDGECGTMLWTCEDRVLMGPTPTASAGHAVTATRHA